MVNFFQDDTLRDRVKRATERADRSDDGREEKVISLLFVYYS